MAKDKNDPYSERPPDSDFQQQNLKAWQPLLTPGWVYGTFFIIGFIFIPIGLLILFESKTVVQTNVLTYKNEELNHTLEITIPQNMKPPIYFYYQLTQFFQNHRRYVKSRSDEQLMGTDGNRTVQCEPLEKNAEGNVLYPCGLVANSYFSDVYGTPYIEVDNERKYINWTDTGISWPSDADKFKKNEAFLAPPYNMSRDGPYLNPLPEVEDESFKVWMRTAALPTFKKLRYIINEEALENIRDTSAYTTDGEIAGDTILHIPLVENRFNVAEGTKGVLLSTTSWLGGKNEFLGYAYVIVGSVCIFLALCFLIKHCVSPRHLGDMRYLNFQNSSSNPGQNTAGGGDGK